MKKIIALTLISCLSLQLTAEKGFGEFGPSVAMPEAHHASAPAAQGFGEFGPGLATASVHSDSMMAEFQQVLDSQGLDAAASWICSKAKDIASSVAASASKPKKQVKVKAMKRATAAPRKAMGASLYA